MASLFLTLVGPWLILPHTIYWLLIYYSIDYYPDWIVYFNIPQKRIFKLDASLLENLQHEFFIWKIQVYYFNTIYFKNEYI